jgi:hypothetical protein
MHRLPDLMIDKAQGLVWAVAESGLRMTDLQAGRLSEVFRVMGGQGLDCSAAHRADAAG